MTRADAGRGVHDQKWKETKNGCLMTMSSVVSEHDPHPELPACFRDRSYVEQLVREMHSPASGPSQQNEENPEISPETADSSVKRIKLMHPSKLESGVRQSPWRRLPACEKDRLEAYPAWPSLQFLALMKH